MAVGRKSRRSRLAVRYVVIASVVVATAALAFGLVRPDASAGDGLVVTGVVVAALAGLEAVWRRDRPLASVGSVVGVAVVFVGGTWLVLVVAGVHAGSLALLGGGALSLYLLYRYQLVALGLVEGER